MTAQVFADKKNSQIKFVRVIVIIARVATGMESMMKGPVKTRWNINDISDYSYFKEKIFQIMSINYIKFITIKSPSW